MVRVTSSWQVTPADYELAEGIVWDAGRERLWWVDIPRGTVLTSSWGVDGLEPVELLRLPTTVSAVAPAEDGSLLIATGRGLAVLDSEGGLTSGPPIAPREDQRFNDGSCDPRGRFLVGTVTDGRILDDERLLSVSGLGSATPALTGLHHSNGMGWSPSGSTMYLVDSVPGRVLRARYDIGSGSAEGWETAFAVSDGLPDGLHVDRAGDLWVAVWGAGEVRRYSPEGKVLEVVEVPTACVTSLTFAGADLTTMVITTARGDGPATVTAGALYSARVSTAGLPDTLWRGFPG